MLAPARHPAADRDLAARVGGPQDAAVVRAQAEPDGRFTDPGHETHLRIAASSPASSTRFLASRARAAQRAQRHRARGELVGPDDDGEPGLAAVGEAELGLQRPAVEGTVGGDPRAPQPRRKVAGRGPVDEVDDEHVDRVGHLAEDVFELAGEEHALDAAPEADPRRRPCRRARRRACRSGRRRARRSAPREAPARRTRRSCACSSRTPARGTRRPPSGCPARRGPRSPARDGRGTARRARPTAGVPPRAAPRSPGPCSRARAAGSSSSGGRARRRARPRGRRGRP